MAERQHVLVKVISQNKDTCPHGHKVGDEWILGETTPQGLCMGAFTSLFPHAWALMFGGLPPGETGPDTATYACPDPDVRIVFELRRLRK